MSRTKLVGILNITPDSFFDGGKYSSVQSCIVHLKGLMRDGVDVVDIGAESTRPNATPITSQEEWFRLKDILPEVIKCVKEYNLAMGKEIKISLDSRHHNNISQALNLGVDIINDVSGCVDKEIIKLAAQSGKKIVVMHNLGVPSDKNKVIDNNLDVIGVLISWMQEKLKQLLDSGVAKEQIIFDVGIGFGKDAKQSIFILKNINKLRVLDLPLYIGHSNKSFLDHESIRDLIKIDNNNYSKLDLVQSRMLKTKLVSQYLIKNGVEYLRVHRHC